MTHVSDDPQHAFMCGDSPNLEDFLLEEQFEEARDDAIERLVNRMLDDDYERREAVE